MAGEDREEASVALVRFGETRLARDLADVELERLGTMVDRGGASGVGAFFGLDEWTQSHGLSRPV